MKYRSVESPQMDYENRRKRNSKMGYDGMKPYGWDTDKYQRLPQSEIKQLRDNTQAPHMFDISTSTQKYDMGRVRYDSIGMKGYGSQAYDYDY